MMTGVRVSVPHLRRPLVRALSKDEAGATAVEYGLIAALIVVAILSALKALGMDVSGLPLQSIINALQSVV
jgi:pilus assembly protein Flp/PilA